MRTTVLLVIATIFSLTACSKNSDLPDYKVEEAILKVYKYRASGQTDSLAMALDGVLPAQVLEPVEIFGPVDLYNIQKISPLPDGDKTVYDAVYKVTFEKGEGTETFKVKKVRNDGVVVGYSYDIAQKVDTASIKKDSIK